MEPNAQIHLFNSHIEAEEAIRELERAGFDIKKLSIVGKGFTPKSTRLAFMAWPTASNHGVAWGLFGVRFGACCSRQRYSFCPVWVWWPWLAPWLLRL